MKIRRSSLFILVLTLLFACKKDESPDYPLGPDTFIDIYVVDANGKDLLDPVNSDNPSFIDTKEITVKDLGGTYVDRPTVGKYATIETINSEYIIINPPNNEQDNYSVRFFLNYHYGKSSLLINWKDSDSDTLSGDIIVKNNDYTCPRVYLNDVVVWEAKGNGREITIKKESPISN